MGEIRSALDIALEKTAGIASDKTTSVNRDLRNTGKKAAGDYLSDGNIGHLDGILSGKPQEALVQVKIGAVSILTAGIRLPSAESDLERMHRIADGINLLLPGQGMSELFAQVEQIFSQYIAEGDRLMKSLEQQFMPRLRAKQQEIAKRYGQTIPLELHQDPEYQAAVTKNKRLLEQKYEPIIEEIRARVHESAGITE